MNFQQSLTMNLKKPLKINLLSLSTLFSILFSTFSYANFSTPQYSLATQNGELHYHQILPAGNSQNPPVILLGGGPGFSSWNLEPIQQTLAKMGFATYLMDMRGIGENAKLSQSPNPLDDWIADIRALQQASGQPKIILAGHSWGALMAMLYARQYPESIQQMLLLNPVDPEKHAMQDLTENIHERNQQELAVNWDDDAAWENDVVVIDNHELARQITEKQITQVLPTYFYHYEQGITYSKQFTHKDFNIDLNVNAWKAYDANPVDYATIRGWKFPIDFVDCQQDSLMPQNLQAMQAQNILRKIAILDQCSHFPWVEQPKEFQNSLQKILSP